MLDQVACLCGPSLKLKVGSVRCSTGHKTPSYLLTYVAQLSYGLRFC